MTTTRKVLMWRGWVWYYAIVTPLYLTLGKRDAVGTIMLISSWVLVGIGCLMRRKARVD